MSEHAFVPRNEQSTRECKSHGPEIHYRLQERWRCRRCIGEAVLRRQHKVRATLLEEAGGRCQICGYDRFSHALVFHHLDPSTKSFAMSMQSGKSLAAYREEAAKCVLLCANCHAEVEGGFAQAPGAPIGWSRARHGRPPLQRAEPRT